MMPRVVMTILLLLATVPPSVQADILSITTKVDDVTLATVAVNREGTAYTYGAAALKGAAVTAFAMSTASP